MSYMKAVPTSLIRRGNISLIRAFTALQDAADTAGKVSKVRAFQLASDDYTMECEEFQKALNELIDFNLCQAIDVANYAIGVGIEVKRPARKKKKPVEVEDRTKRFVTYVNQLIVGNHPGLKGVLKKRETQHAKTIQEYLDRNKATLRQLTNAAQYAAGHRTNSFSWADQFRAVTKLLKNDKDGMPYVVRWLNDADREDRSFESPAPYHQEFDESTK